jgi:glycosyltransferase involved in cell wall biosynthesis
MKVFIQQPVITAYREAYFLRLAKLEGIEVTLHASPTVPGCPKSNKGRYDFKHVWHECKSFIGGRFFWQQGMNLPAKMKAGDVLVYNSNPRYLSHFGLVYQAKKRGVKIIAWNHAMSSSSGGLSSRLRKKFTDWSADLILLYTDGEVDLMHKEGYPSERLHALNNTLDPQPVLEACGEWSVEKGKIHELHEGHEKNIKLVSTDYTNYTGEERALAGSLQGARSKEQGERLGEQGGELIAQLRNESSAKLDEFRREQGLENKELLLFCGRVTQKTSLHLIIEAMSSLPQDVVFAVIGDGEMKAQWQQLAQELNLAERVKWLGAIYGEESLAPWFLSASLFVYPGAVGLSVNHAMLYGLPVVTHNVAADHMPEFHYLTDNVNARLCKKDDSASLAQCLKASLQNPGELKLLSEAALDSAWEEFTFDKMIQRFAQALRIVRSN